MVKRVIAVGPGEVEIGDDRVTVDDRPSPHVPVDGTPGAGRWVVGPGEVFLLSDAPRRTDSDSRSWGPIDVASVVGSVRWRYRPLSRFGRPT